MVQRSVEGHPQTSNNFTLVSWKDRNGLWKFALRRGEVKAESALKVDSRFLIGGVDPLLRTLKKLPPNSGVNWRADPSEGLSYPPLPIRNRIVNSCVTAGVDIQFNFPTSH